MSRAGFVLVGGRSSRMGADKALLPFRGSTLCEYVAHRVLEAAGSVTLVGSPGRYGSLGFPVLDDRLSGRGPLGGIETALGATGAEWNLMVACDMPGVTTPMLGALLEAAEEEASCDCLLPLGVDGRVEPLCAVYRRDCLPALRRALETGVHRITDAVSTLRVAYRPAPPAAFLRNLNTPEEWRSFLASEEALTPHG